MKAMFMTLLIIMIIVIVTPATESNQIPTKNKFQELKIKILNCESGLKHHNVWGDNHKSYGIAQFQLRTFNYLKEKANMPKLKWKSLKDQLWLFDWSLRNGYEKNWTCYRKCTG